MTTVQPPGLPDAWVEIAAYTLDASKVVFGSENYPVACELAWGSAENAVKAAMFHKAEGEEVPMLDYKTHDVEMLYKWVTTEDTLGVLESVAEFNDYDEHIRYPEWRSIGKIRMPADKYTETKAEKALVSAGLILDAARAYVVN